MQEIFDAHCHIIDPKYPLITNQGFRPDYYTVADYQTELEAMDLKAVGGAVVAGSFQGFDQSYFADALSQLGDKFVGVTQVPISITDQDLAKLHTIGIRAIRFNLYRGINLTLADLEYLANRVYQQHGWHTELYVDLSTMTEDLYQLLFRLPNASIDHFGMGVTPIDKLKEVVSHNVAVKVTGFGRVKYSRTQLKQIIRDLYRENPQALIFGTDLPSTRATNHFSIEDVQLIKEVLSVDELDKVLLKNGLARYLNK